MSETYNTVISILQGCPRQWKKVHDNLGGLALKKTKKGTAYGIYYNESFTGLFIPSDMVKPSEFKILRGTME